MNNTLPHNSHIDPIPLSTLLSANHLDPQHIIPNLLPQGLTLLLGQPRIGKSWLTLHLALSVATGDTALAHFPTPQADVLYLGLQDTPRRIALRAHKLLGTHSIPNTFFWTNQWLPTSLSDHSTLLTRLSHWLLDHPNTRLIVIDSLDQLSPTPASSSTFTTQHAHTLLHSLKELAERHQLAILLTGTLSPKANRYPLHDLMYTPSLAIADTLLILKHDRSHTHTTLHLTSTDLPDQDLALHLPADTLRWTYLSPAADYHLSQERQDILALLDEHGGGPLRPKDIATLLHKDVRAVTKLLFDMSHASQLSLSGRGLYMSIHTTTPDTTLYGSDVSHPLAPNMSIQNTTSNISNDSNIGNESNISNDNYPRNDIATHPTLNTTTNGNVSNEPPYGSALAHPLPHHNV